VVPTQEDRFGGVFCLLDADQHSGRRPDLHKSFELFPREEAPNSGEPEVFSKKNPCLVNRNGSNSVLDGGENTERRTQSGKGTSGGDRTSLKVEHSLASRSKGGISVTVEPESAELDSVAPRAKWFTVKQLAKHSGYPEQEVLRLLRKRLLLCHYSRRRTLLIYEADFLRFKERGTM
jgi:hypothetical protein